MRLLSENSVQHIAVINNAILVPLSEILMWINTLIGIVVGVVHVYIPVPTTFGLIAGIILALSSAMSMQINARFTQSNTTLKKDTRTQKDKVIPAEDNIKSNTFIAISLPCIFLTSVSLFFSLYTSVPLMTNALPFSLPEATVHAIALLTSISLGLGTFINSWLQTFVLWEKCRHPSQAMGSNEMPSLSVIPKYAKSSHMLYRPEKASKKCSDGYHDGLTIGPGFSVTRTKGLFFCPGSRSRKRDVSMASPQLSYRH